MAGADGSITVNLKSDMSTYKVHIVCNRYVTNHAENSLKYGCSIYQTMIDACKCVTIYSDKQGLYKRTRKNNGTGVNPVSLEGVVVTGWRIQRCSPQLLCISFNLSRNGRQLQVKRYLICYNARIADDV